MSRRSATAVPRIWFEPMHAGQMRAYLALSNHRFKALRCGRRFGKTALAMSWAAKGLLNGEEVGWFAPEYKHMIEVFVELKRILAPLVVANSKSPLMIRLSNGGRIDFFPLSNAIAARGRRYHRVVVDEGAFAKNGDNRSDDSMMAIWEKAIKPTLLDYAGRAIVCSNSAGKDPDNFFYAICTEPKYGFVEYHATTLDNPLLPKRGEDESAAAWLGRRERILDDLKASNDPRVYAQEYLAEFVDWSGAAFFSREKLLVEDRPLPFPARCEYVVAVIDTATKTGTGNDATAVTFFARDKLGAIPLYVLDWDVVQIEGAVLEIWLPSVFSRLEELARACGARLGSAGALVEDKNSGTILLQQARLRGWPARAIESKLTSMGKEERAISVSGYVYRGWVKYTETAFNKTTIYKQRSRNHLVDQVESFRVGDKRSDREDDLLDTFCYGIALALGDGEGF
jgi:hypothetical protein